MCLYSIDNLGLPTSSCSPGRRGWSIEHEHDRAAVLTRFLAKRRSSSEWLDCHFRLRPRVTARKHDGPVLEYQVPHDEERTECTRAVEENSCTTGSLTRPLEFLVSPSNIFGCEEGILYQLLDVFVLLSQVGDKR